MTFYHKRVVLIVILVFGLISAGAIWSQGVPPIGSLMLPLVFLAANIYIFYLSFDVVDEVWDAGDALIVRNRGHEERIALTAISHLSYSRLLNPPRVTLVLQTPSPLGDEIAFLAPFRLVAFAESPPIDDLIDRVDATRRRVWGITS